MSIRPYDPEKDLESTIHVFRETCDASLKIEPIWTIASYIWCRPYLRLSPETCFVIDDGRGRVVGYILGTSNTDEFCRRWREDYVAYTSPELDSLPPAPSSEQNDGMVKKRDYFVSCIRNDPEALAYGNLREELRPYSGHLHIDILPSHQRQGLGRHLIQRFLAAIKGEGCKGVYLGMAGSNDAAGKFYEACGFKRLPHVLDNGASGEMGRTAKREDGGQTVYYVIDL